jgi:hypothetical protein
MLIFYIKVQDSPIYNLTSTLLFSLRIRLLAGIGRIRMARSDPDLSNQVLDVEQPKHIV